MAEWRLPWHTDPREPGDTKHPYGSVAGAREAQPVNLKAKRALDVLDV